MKFMFQAQYMVNRLHIQLTKCAVRTGVFIGQGSTEFVNLFCPKNRAQQPTRHNHKVHITIAISTHVQSSGVQWQLHPDKWHVCSVDGDNNPCLVIGLEQNPHPVIAWKGIKQGKVKQEVRAFKSEGIAPGLSTWCPHREDDKLAKTTLCNLSSLPEVFSCGPLVFCPYGIVHVQCCLVLVCASPVYGLPGTMFNWGHLDMGHASTGKRKSGSRRGSPMSHTSAKFKYTTIWLRC